MNVLGYKTNKNFESVCNTTTTVLSTEESWLMQ